MNLLFPMQFADITEIASSKHRMVVMMMSR